MAKTSMRFCKDCKWCSPDDKKEYAKCHHPNNMEQEISPDAMADYMVSGDSKFVADPERKPKHYCSTLRKASEYLKHCGPDAKWFEFASGISVEDTSDGIPNLFEKE